MVVGEGLIGNHFQKEYAEREDILIFASGVSNSREDHPYEFERELNLVKRCVSVQDYKRKFVYFSTISIYDPSLKDNPYQQHKLAVEQYLTDNVPDYLIVRAPNVIGQGGNKTNLLNFLHNRIKGEKPFEVWEYAERNFLDIQDLGILMDGLLKNTIGSTTINLVYPYSYAILEIVAVMEACLLKRAKIRVIPKGASYVPKPTDLVNDLYKEYNITVSQDYLARVVRRYFRCAP